MGMLTVLLAPMPGIVNTRVTAGAELSSATSQEKSNSVPSLAVLSLQSMPNLDALSGPGRERETGRGQGGEGERLGRGEERGGMEKL